jgi:hypothetical protein
MKFSRRKFLAATPLAIGALLPFNSLANGIRLARGYFSVPGGTSGDPLSRLTWDSFYPYIETNFAFRDSGGSAVDLQLAKMADTKPRGFKPTGPGQECFAMTFSGSLRKPLVQDVYSVEHFALGSYRLLITVVGKTRTGILYEAVINRIVG